VPDPHPPHGERHSGREDKRSLFQKIVEFINPGPDSTDELIETLAEAEDNAVIDAQSRVMLEGVLRLAEMTAGDAMVAAPRMDLLDINASYEDLLKQVISTRHSRFPVYQGEHENIIGILLAKDLLKLQRAPELNIKALLRPAVFVPESKSLNDLLRNFRLNRNHLAIVVDEFGRIAGLITIEDVLEEIVGEIEDEFDDNEAEGGDIFALADHTWRVSGDTLLSRVNEEFGVNLAATPVDSDLEVEFDTVGGLIAHAIGHVPRRGEHVELGGLQFQVLLTKSGAVRWFKVTRSATNTSS
jgi:magnesium and cobalt transporter